MAPIWIICTVKWLKTWTGNFSFLQLQGDLKRYIHIYIYIVNNKKINRNFLPKEYIQLLKQFSVSIKFLSLKLWIIPQQCFFSFFDFCSFLQKKKCVMKHQLTIKFKQRMYNNLWVKSRQALETYRKIQKWPFKSQSYIKELCAILAISNSVQKGPLSGILNA